MRALLIDPIEQKVSEFDYDGDSSKIYEMLETSGHRPRFFDVVSIPWGMDGIYIDDEGLYAPIQYRWSFHAKTHYVMTMVNLTIARVELNSEKII